MVDNGYFHAWNHPVCAGSPQQQVATVGQFPNQSWAGRVPPCERYLGNPGLDTRSNLEIAKAHIQAAIDSLDRKIEESQI